MGIGLIVLESVFSFEMVDGDSSFPIFSMVTLLLIVLIWCYAKS